MADETIGLWEGRPIEDLSKDELLEVIKFFSSERERIISQKNDIEGMVEKFIERCQPHLT